MEEKKFPWLLRLLSINKISIHILDTFVANKERIIGIFCLDADSQLNQYSTKATGFKTTYGCLKYILKSRNSDNSISSKHCYFYHKGKRTEIPAKQLINYVNFCSGIPLITYIQSSREDSIRFLVFSVEYWKEGYKSNFIPPSSHPDVLENAKELVKYLIGIIEIHEKRKVVNMQVEFMVSSNNTLWLSHMEFCKTVTPEQLNSFSIMRHSKEFKICTSNELLEIINELDSPRNVLQRRPSLIRKLGKDASLAELIKIESPELDVDSEESELDETSSKTISPVKKEEKKVKISKNYLELISKTRVIVNSPRRKIQITDQEFEDEYKKIAFFFSRSPNPSIAERGEPLFRKPSLIKTKPIRLFQNKSERITVQTVNSLSARRVQNPHQLLFSPILTRRSRNPAISTSPNPNFFSIDSPTLTSYKSISIEQSPYLPQ